MTVSFAAFEPADAVAILVQPSQWVQAGIDARTMTIDAACDLAARGAAWSARDPQGRLLCCAGIVETFPGRQGTAWAMLAEALGVRQHLAITRFARARIAGCGLVRVESLVDADPAGRCAKWATAVGLTFNTVLHGWGADSGTVLLFDRVLSCRR